VDFLGEPLVRRQARTLLAAPFSEVLVVAGHAAERVVEALAGLPVNIVDNPRYRQGQSTSVAAAVERLAATSAAALFVPCDQPLLTAAVLGRLIWAFRRTGAPIVVPAFRGRRGAPVLFARHFFAALAGLEGDVGGRQLLGRYADQVATVALDEEEALWDADTAEDLERLRRLARGEDGGAAP
jgi:molybdenum cofactor cytidylyltransferase